MLKMGIITGFLSRTKDRFHDYNEPLELEKKFEMMTHISGYDGVEILCDHPHLFPGKTGKQEIEALREQLTTLGLGISNLNANTANGYYQPLPPENVFEPSLSSACKASRAFSMLDLLWWPIRSKRKASTLYCVAQVNRESTISFSIM